MTERIDIAVAGLPPTAEETLVLYVAEGEPPAGAAAEIWARTGLDWQAVAEAARLTGGKSRSVELLVPPALGIKRLLILETGGARERVGLAAWAERGGTLASRLASSRKASVVLDEPGASPEAIAEFAAGLKLRCYRFDKYKTAKPKNGEPEGPLAVTLHVADPDAVHAAMAERMSVVEGTLLARTLVNEPPNALGPAEFAETAGKLAELGVDVDVLEAAEMEKLGMAALLAVARGSARAPRLVVMQWNGAGDDSSPVAFVGKGVVFDTGGISIKPGNSMEDMKGDMGGAAAVTGLMRALATRTARVNAVGVVGLVENMPDGDAYRPGDILRTMSGKTVEIVNTDAEGRLVLADALWYAKERFRPKAMVDLATLTGAIITALGHEHAGLFANDDGLAEALYRAGLASGEKVWRMPLAAAYDKQIESRFADIKNTGGRPAGSATAAQFLQNFVGEVPWAHLDIAGMAFGGGSTETNTSWATGFGVALLDRLVRDRFER